MWYFISKYKNYSLQVTIEEVKHTINFRDIGNYPTFFAGGGIFETEDEDIANALIALPVCAALYEPSNPADGFPPGKDIIYSDYDAPVDIWGGGPPSTANEVIKSGEFKIIDQLDLEAPNAPTEGTLVHSTYGLYSIRAGVAEKILTKTNIDLELPVCYSKSKIVTLVAGTHTDLNSLLFPDGLRPGDYTKFIDLIGVTCTSGSGNFALSWRGTELCNNSVTAGNIAYISPTKQVNEFILDQGVISAVSSVPCHIQLIVKYININILVG